MTALQRGLIRLTLSYALALALVGLPALAFFIDWSA